MDKHKNPTCKEQIIKVLKSEGGIATLQVIYKKVDMSFYVGKTPESTIRNCLQKKSKPFLLR